MCFDVPKVVRSPVYDHGHDEESRNGRDIKIDILDDYVWTSEVFRVSLDEYRSSECFCWACCDVIWSRHDAKFCCMR